MKHFRLTRFFCCMLTLLAIQSRSLAFSQNTDPAAGVPPEAPVETFEAEAYPGRGANEAKEACKNSNARNVVFTVALFGIAAIALAFVSHNAD
ncbi:MAG: hypothetical protein Tsb0015_08720 [Simkaniaceae bacterium]